MGNKLSYPEVDLSSKVAIVTGGNTGIGYETAKGLARLGAHTFVASRSKERAEGAIERMKAELGHVEESRKGREESRETTEGGEEAAEQDKEGGREEGKGGGIKVEYIPLDLSSFQSTIDCVRAFKEKDLPLHILINNAAIAYTPYNKTADGFEAQFQVNHLGPMLLTLELLPLLLDAAASSGDGHILFLSSAGHFLAPSFNVNDLDKPEAEYRRLEAYYTTKLCSVMTGFALQRRLQNKNITVSSVDPGTVNTEAARGSEDSKIFHFMLKVFFLTVGRKPVTGAATSLNCAVNPELNSQQHFYYDSCQPKEPSLDARNETFQEQLWSKSFEFLKDYLSPETVENYGPKIESEVGTAAGNEEIVVTSDNQATNAGTTGGGAGN